MDGEQTVTKGKPCGYNVFRSHGQGTTYSASTTFEILSGSLIVRESKGALLAINLAGDWKSVNDS